MIVFQADGLDFDCNVVFDGTTGASTMIGGSAHVDLLNLSTEVKTAGNTTILGHTKVNCLFAEWSIDPGDYSVQVRCKPLGYPSQTVKEFTITVEKSAGSPP